MSDQNKKSSILGTDRAKFIAVVAGAVALIGGSFGIQAIASSKTYQHMQLAASEPSSYKGMFQKSGWSRDGHHRGHWGGRWGGRDRFANMSDAEIEKKVERLVKHVAIEIDATAEQQTKITALVSAIAKDMKPMRGTMRAAGKQVHELLLKDAIDREALEKLRTERLADIDRMSKNITTALADVAEVLTVEQRKKLDERIKEFRSHRGGWRRG